MSDLSINGTRDSKPTDSLFEKVAAIEESIHLLQGDLEDIARSTNRLWSGSVPITNEETENKDGIPIVLEVTNLVKRLNHITNKLGKIRSTLSLPINEQLFILTK